MQAGLRAGRVSFCRYASPNCQAHCAASDSVAGDEVIVSIAGHVSRAIRTATMSFSLTFFNDHEGNVIGLRHALSEFLNGFQEPRLERLTSRGGLLPNDS